MPSVFRTSQAHDDLVQIALHIAEQNPAAADQWLDVIGEKRETLARMPEIGRRRPELSQDLRSLAVGNYIIFYRPVQDGIQVIRVLHGARDLPTAFLDKP